MFRVQQEMQVKQWPVRIRQPVDGGKVETVEVSMDFVLPTTAEREELTGLKSDRAAMQKLASYVTGWDGIEDHEGQPMAFTREALVALMERYPFVAAAVINALTQACLGAAAKN